MSKLPGTEHDDDAEISVYLSGAVRIPLALHAHYRAVALCGCSHNCACVSKLPPLIMLHPRTARRYAQIPAFRNGRQTGIFSIPECTHFMENAPHREYNKISSCHLKPCRHDLLKASHHNSYLPAGRLRVNACPGTCNQCT